jgi:hypothetical protein
MIISNRILKMRNISNKSCREYQSTNFMFSNIFRENCAVYEIMKILVGSEPANGNMACVLHAGLLKLHACALHLHSHTCSHAHALTRMCAQTQTQKYVILTAFLQQQWFCECASVLCLLPVLLLLLLLLL